MMTNFDVLEANIKYANSRRDEIWEDYGDNKYVVIRDQQVIDSGDDGAELERKYYGQDILVRSTRKVRLVMERAFPERG